MFSPLLYNSNVSLENCPSNFSNVPLHFDEWDRMSPLYPDLDRSLLKEICPLAKLAKVIFGLEGSQPGRDGLQLWGGLSYTWLVLESWTYPKIIQKGRPVRTEVTVPI